MRLTARLFLLLALAFAHAPLAMAEFHFVALGDTAYNGEHDYPVFEALIDEINASKPAFSVHVGDIWGPGSCGDAHVAVVSRFFERFDHPLMYTPGDNEWVDCNTGGLGGFDPLERLARLRATFFGSNQSLGAARTVVRQADVSEHTQLVENARWLEQNVLFTTVHVPGSRNGADHRRLDMLAEFSKRNAGNVAWLHDAFRLAIAENLAAVVIVLHAEMFASDDYYAGPFGATLAAIREGGERFDKPVLLINGDFHQFIVDRPFAESRGEDTLPRFANIVRLQVFGAPEIRAVKVTVDPDSRAVFGFEPLY